MPPPSERTPGIGGIKLVTRFNDVRIPWKKAFETAGGKLSGSEVFLELKDASDLLKGLFKVSRADATGIQQTWINRIHAENPNIRIRDEHIEPLVLEMENFLGEIMISERGGFHPSNVSAEMAHSSAVDTAYALQYGLAGYYDNGDEMGDITGPNESLASILRQTIEKDYDLLFTDRNDFVKDFAAKFLSGKFFSGSKYIDEIVKKTTTYLKGVTHHQYCIDLYRKGTPGLAELEREEESPEQLEEVVEHYNSIHKPSVEYPEKFRRKTKKV